MDCKTRFAQIEKECLAILFACERFDLYLYGREKITVETDHQLLVSIFKKSLEAAPLHLQKLRMRLHQYSIKVVYRKGSQLYLANTLSRVVTWVNYVCPQFVDMTESIESVDPRLTLMVCENSENSKSNYQWSVAVKIVCSYQSWLTALEEPNWQHNSTVF